jgi:hypothetical protein
LAVTQVAPNDSFYVSSEDLHTTIVAFARPMSSGARVCRRVCYARKITASGTTRRHLALSFTQV